MKAIAGAREVVRGSGCRRSNRRARAAADGYWGLVAAGEPFRLLFPLGTVIGVYGVMMWPLFVWCEGFGYPGVPHARIMIEGFLGCFVAGFLGTALPRLLGVPRVSLAETLACGAALVSAVCLHAGGLTMWGDLVFFCTMLSLVLALGARALIREDTPPPAFVLVAMGLLSAMAGSFGLAVSQATPALIPPWLTSFARLLLNQGFLLLPAMGVGAFLLPRFFGLPNRQSFPESIVLPPGWIRRAGFAALCGVVVLASFAMEVAGFASEGLGVRVAAFVVYFFREVPIHRAGWGGGSLAFGLRIALFAIPVGFVLAALVPVRAIALMHFVFITGFGLLALIVATRVVLGHSGQSEKFQSALWPVKILCGLIVLAMLTRVSADWMPKVQMSHYAYAALAWIAGVLVWTAFILPGVTRADAK